MMMAWLRRGFWLLLLAMIGLPEVSRGEPIMAIGLTNGVAGTTVQVPIVFTTDTSVSKLVFDLVFNPVTLTAGAATGGEALTDQEVASSQVTSNSLRVGIFSFSDALLKNGTVAYVPLTIASNELASVEILALTNMIMYDATETNMVSPVGILNRNLGIIIPARFNRIGFTNGVAHLGLMGAPGTNYVIQTATNLVSPQWKPLVTNAANSNGVVQYNDNAAGGVLKRFYRAVRTN
jgi:hypothetical protein